MAYRPVTAISAIAYFCVLNVRINFWYLLFSSSGFCNRETESSFVFLYYFNANCSVWLWNKVQLHLSTQEGRVIVKQGSVASLNSRRHQFITTIPIMPSYLYMLNYGMWKHSICQQLQIISTIRTFGCLVSGDPTEISKYSLATENCDPRATTQIYLCDMFSIFNGKLTCSGQTNGHMVIPVSYTHLTLPTNREV